MNQYDKLKQVFDDLKISYKERIKHHKSYENLRAYEAGEFGTEIMFEISIGIARFFFNEEKELLDFMGLHHNQFFPPGTPFKEMEKEAGIRAEKLLDEDEWEFFG